MATLTLGTSISSSHKDDFYSTTSEYWIKVNNVHGNYYSSDSDCPYGNPMDFYVRIYGTDTWKSIGGCSDFDYEYASCYQYCVWDFVYARYYNFNNPNDIDNGKYIDKIAVTYLGLRAESFVNRCFVNITAKDSNNVPLPGVKILDSNISTVNDSNFWMFSIENAGEEICTPTNQCRDPLYTELTSTLKECTNTEISLMQTQKQNDVILIGTNGIPNKLIFTISTPGIYDGLVHYQYWNGVEWIYFPEIGIIDNTNGFRNSGVKEITLPEVSNWKKMLFGTILQPIYTCRAIFDSISSVTTIPKASCFKWSGSYETLTNENGVFNFSIFTSGGKTINVPGLLNGYIPVSGNGQIMISEATSDKDINLVLIKSDLTCDVTCPTPVYTKQTKDILVTSSVSNGNILNTLTISSPKTETVTFKPSSGTNIPISYTFNEETLYKIQLKTYDDGGNVKGKTCYANVTTAPSCNLLTDQISCESNGCFWNGNNCISTNPNTELSNIYDSIINKTDCISDECINILDLNNDGIINITDKELSTSLTYNETTSKILSYQICKELNPCRKSENIITLIGASLAIGYIGYVGYKSIIKITNNNK